MPMRNVFLLLVTILFAAGPSFTERLVAAAGDAKKDDGAVYELRTYTTYPGKLPDLHKRFRDNTMRIFEKHGMKNIGYWVPTDQPDTLIYIIEHKSRQAAAESWKAFRADPEWQQVYKDSRKNGALVKKVVSVYMHPTDYSPIK